MRPKDVALDKESLASGFCQPTLRNRPDHRLLSPAPTLARQGATGLGGTDERTIPTAESIRPITAERRPRLGDSCIERAVEHGVSARGGTRSSADPHGDRDIP